MIGGRTNSSTRPTALGTLLNASTYGATIPTYHGTTRGSLLAIWAAHLRQGGSGKKGKGKGKKGQVPTFIENVDFLIGSNPIEAALQFWSNNSNRYTLNFTKARVNAILSDAIGPYMAFVDSHFYFLLAVTAEVTLAGTFNDYGAQGPSSYSGTYEYPLWNAAQHGPDLTNPGAVRWWPFIFYWRPAFGPKIYIPFYQVASAPGNGIPNGNGFLNIYYAQLSHQTKFVPPVTYNRMTFEEVLGNGTEYSDAGLSSQQIQYPFYAGLGSSDIDLGSSGMLPDWRVEVKGSNALYAPRGDADFVDMIEDTIKSGQLQTGAQLGLIQRGLNCSDLPGIVQRSFYGQLEPSPTLAPIYYQPNQKGSVLIAFFRWRPSGGSNPTISDAATDVWTTVMASPNCLLATASSVGAPAGNAVTGVFNGSGVAYDGRCYIFEMDPGSNQVLKTAVSQGSSASNPQVVSCSIYVSQACFIVVAAEVQNYDASSVPQHWDSLASSLDPLGQPVVLMKRFVSAPGVYTFSLTLHGGYWNIGMVAVGGGPSSLPKALGNILDDDSLQLTRMQCRANGLIGSIVMDSQRKAEDWLKEFGQCANAEYVWSGFKLKLIPRSEASEVGNGVVYIPPTASGPVAFLTENDLIGDSSNPIITVERTAQVDANNILQIEHVDRNNDYNISTASQPESGAIALFGPRKQAPVSLHEIQDPAVARKILAVTVRRLVYLRNIYKFKLKAKWAPLEAMDVVAINDSQTGIVNLPVRLMKISENEKLELECEAEPFIYGLNSPDPLTQATASAPNNQNAQYVPGPINPPIIFEPPGRMWTGTKPELWTDVSDSDPEYGGSVVYVSVDGGTSYVVLGVIQGNGTTGYVITADWPAAADPDATDTLDVDLTESLGSLANYTADQENAFLFPCYVGATPSPTPSFSAAIGIYNGIEPSRCIGVNVPSSGNYGVIFAESRYSGIGVWLAAPGYTTTLRQVNDNCSDDHFMVAISPSGAPGCTCPGQADQGVASLVQINIDAVLFPYDLESLAVTLNNCGALAETRVGSAGTVISMDEVSFDSTGMAAGQIMLLKFIPAVPGNPNLFMAVVSRAAGVPAAPSGWTLATSGGTTTFRVYTRVGTVVEPPNFYELMTYQTATLTAANKYSLPASSPAPLRRSVFGVPYVGQGIDHGIGSRFAWLNSWQLDSAPGILKATLDPTWINQQLFFKFVPFNKLGGGIGDLSDAIPYSYTPTGIESGSGSGSGSGGGGGTSGGTGGQPGQSSYSITSGGVLSQPTATSIAMTKAIVAFPGNGVYYNARTFTIPAPTQPTTYYVTIHDPNELGDTGTSTTLTAEASTSNDKVGAPGYVYIGSIVAVPGGGGTVIGPGGFPIEGDEILFNGV